MVTPRTWLPPAKPQVSTTRLFLCSGPTCDRIFVSERRWSLIILSVAIVIILSITAAGLCVHFLIDQGNLRKIILLALIGLLVVVGALSFAFLECIRRAELRRRDVIMMRSEQRQRIFPTAPEMSGKTSWAYSTPWRYSKGSATKT